MIIIGVKKTIEKIIRNSYLRREESAPRSQKPVLNRVIKWGRIIQNKMKFKFVVTRDTTNSANMTSLATSLPVAQRLEPPTEVREVMGSTPVGDSDFFFVPRS